METFFNRSETEAFNRNPRTSQECLDGFHLLKVIHGYKSVSEPVSWCDICVMSEPREAALFLLYLGARDDE